MFGVVVLVAACGSKRSSGSVTRAVPAASVPFASGPISNACLAADRKAASRRMCGCIQAVANQKLSGAQQSKAAAFFADPHQAQEERQNGSRSFWKTYKAYAASAENTCKAA